MNLKALPGVQLVGVYLLGGEYVKVKHHFLYKTVIHLLLVTFIGTTALPPSMAEAIGLSSLPKPGQMAALSSAYQPALIRGLKVDTANPFKFDFIIDNGQDRLEEGAFDQEATRLIKYFLAALTIKDEDLWVNLSPLEKDRITTEELGVTEMGRDLLAQDYLLKQIASSMTYPEEGLGQKFWDRVYQKAQEQFGTTDVNFDTFNKVWIIPAQAEVYEDDGTAFVLQSQLKVMLDRDYKAEKADSDDKVVSDKWSVVSDEKVISDKWSVVSKEQTLDVIEENVAGGRWPVVSEEQTLDVIEEKVVGGQWSGKSKW